MIYLQLFLSFLQIGALSFGGGSAAMPLLQAQIVTQHRWLSLSEFPDLVTITEMTPGPIAVNAATFVGTKIAGVPGALVATAGCILPACILVTLIARLYFKYRSIAVLQSVLGSLRPAVVAMIASAGVLILRNAFWSGAVSLSGTNRNMVVLFAAAFLLLRKTKLSPILVMLLAGAANLPGHTVKNLEKTTSAADRTPIFGVSATGKMRVSFLPRYSDFAPISRRRRSVRSAWR